MKVDDIWKNLFSYSEYSKGADYSASDIIGDVLAVRLKKDNPTKIHIDYENKISAFIGSSIHLMAERWLDSEKDYIDNIQSEVKLKHRNISGTADLIIDGNIIADYKTGKESNIKIKLREIAKGGDSSWIKQLSIYNYLNHKQNGVEYSDEGYILWLCTDNNKHGVQKVTLLKKELVVSLIKNFLKEVEQPIEDMSKCNLCVQFKHKFCGVSSICPYIQKTLEQGIDEW